MKTRIRNLSASCLCLLLFSSCCNEKDLYYWFPKEAVRYYNEHDTVTFYSSELDEFEVYPVCTRDTLIGLEDTWPGSVCGHIVYSYSIEYNLKKDSCEAVRKLNLQINADTSIYFTSIYSDTYFDHFRASYNQSLKTPIEVLGKSYDNTIELRVNTNPNDSLESIVFSLEYGIIQYHFENVTFSLINDEK